MPGDGDAVVEFLAVLRVNTAAVFHGLRDPLFRRHRGEFGRIDPPDVGAEQDTLALAEVTRAGIGDIADRKVGIADAAVDLLIFLPEAALELQSHFDRGGVRASRDRPGHRRADLHRYLAEDGQWNRADAPVGACGLPRFRRARVLVSDAHAALVLAE